MKLSMKAFRGVHDPFEIEFNPKGNVSIVYGENGSGKTTISDALEFVFNGSSGSLEEKSLDGKSRIPFLVHVQCAKEDLSVTWTDSDAILKATIDKTKVRRTGTSTTRLHTLSRRHITKLVEEAPAKRFARIQEFISIPALEKEEENLKQFIKEQQQLQQSQVLAVTQFETNLDTLYQKETNSTTPQLPREKWIEQTFEDSPQAITENKTVLSALNHEITRLREDFRTLETSYSIVQSAETALRSEHVNLAELVENSTHDFTEALDTLQSAQRLFNQIETNSCPVCDTTFTHLELKEKVTNKLTQLKSLATQSAAVKKAETQVTRSNASLTAQQNNYLAIITKLKMAYQAAAECNQWDFPPLIPELLIPTQAEDLTEQWFNLLKTNAAALEPLSQDVDISLKNLETQLHLQTQLRAILSQKKDIKTEHDILTALISKAEKIATVLRKERIQYANETLASVSEDFARLYKTIHPGENIENIRLYLHPDKKASAQFDGTLFGSENMTPVACLSESHLDTLGLCLFLTLQKKDTPKNSIIYLDDAIASVDEAHMERLYNLILDEASHYKHVIISSHYQPLRFKFRWGILTQKKVNFIELGKWSIDQGINLAKGPNSEIALLRKYLDENEDAGTIATKSGIILEQILDFLTGIYHCRLPRHPGAEQRWTLDNYMSGLKGNKGKLFSALRCDHIAQSEVEGETLGQETVTGSHNLSDLLTPIFALLQFRNAIGCHFKELAGQFDELSEASKLGRATLDLVDALCDDDDELPTSCKDGMSWANRGTITRRLYPLQAPQ